MAASRLFAGEKTGPIKGVKPAKEPETTDVTMTETPAPEETKGQDLKVN